MNSKLAKIEIEKVLKAEGIANIDQRLLKLTMDKARRMSRQYFSGVDWASFLNEFSGYLIGFYNESAAGAKSTTLTENAAHIRKGNAQNGGVRS